MEYEEEFLVPMEIKPTKATNLITTAVRARNGLAIGHGRRNSRIGEWWIENRITRCRWA